MEAGLAFGVHSGKVWRVAILDRPLCRFRTWPLMAGNFFRVTSPRAWVEVKTDKGRGLRMPGGSTGVRSRAKEPLSSDMSSLRQLFSEKNSKVRSRA